ncbi:SDR family NAD(P)-dependent oxidoreductase [Paraburkholderia sp. MM5384-R2]|uniref:SDR family NAD(P)-dependent oxidoreductase n=1 Tax=Paraburkholderia sp. MM5384-R2 TaxID=2723097 RepID=UPI0018157E9D|nr:SDR family NAD(P)-dependent oxidoreductase [Paraburkholderia sp. MM5384-R2]MBB5496037.1 short-subunit dehydrogenase [Paraburkholderia sp. MM5384-R2]
MRATRLNGKVLLKPVVSSKSGAPGGLFIVADAAWRQFDAFAGLVAAAVRLDPASSDRELPSPACMAETTCRIFGEVQVKKTVLITGASSGFGLMLANHLHQQGFTVIGTSREPEKYAGKVPYKLLRLNIDEDSSIEALADELFRHVKQLDVLVNNAGYMVTGIAEETPIKLGRQQFETNFWGAVKVTNALLPKFRAQKHGQIITVSSIVGLIGPPNLSYYTASKHAVQGFFKSLRFELNQFNIKVSMVEPVWFKTNLGNNAVSAGSGNIADYNAYRKQVTAATQKGIDEAEAPDTVVNSITKLINARAPKFSNPVGKMTGMILFLQNYAPKIFEGSILKSVRTAN